MDKKDIYEHLAKIYLDASLKGETPEYTRLINFIIIAVIATAAVLIFLLIAPRKNISQNYKPELLLQPQLTKLGLLPGGSQNAAYYLSLNKGDLTRFRTLEFSLKGEGSGEPVAMRIKFMNTSKEKAEVYLENISPKWRDYSIPLSDFKNIADWSEMFSLSFAPEGRGGGKKNTVYIDKIKILR